MCKKKVVVIGSGIAGVTIANKLVNEFDVTVLEKGDNKISLPKIKFLKRDFAVANTYCYSHGGTSKLWHNGLIDIPTSDVSDKFKKILLSICNLTNTAAGCLNYVGDFEKDKAASLNDIKKTLNRSDLDLDNILIPKKSPPLQLDEKAKLVTNASIKKYYIENDSVVALDYTSNNLKSHIKMDMLVVCAGGIGSPKVLSSITKEAKKLNENIGKNLIDHPMGFIGKIRVKKEYKKLFSQLSHQNYHNYTSRTGIVIKNKCGANIFYIRPAITMDNRLSIYKFKSALGASSWKERAKLFFDFRIYHPDIIQEILAHLFNFRIVTRNFSVWAVFEQRQSSSYVDTRSSDEDIISWSITASEIKSYRAAIDKLQTNIETYIDKSKFEYTNLSNYLWSAAHHSGTCSFYKKKPVVDENLKLIGFNNVYVCDGSVIPEHSYANTGLTIAKLSIRLCNYLIKSKT